MSRIALRALLLAGLLGATTRAQAPDPLRVSRTQLAENIYLFSASSDLDYWTSSNSVVIIGDDGVTVFDTNARPSTSRQVIAGIRSLTPKPVRTLVNSHWHMDHWFGNEEYARAFPGVQIIATTETREYMTRLPLEFFVNGLGLAGAQARLDTAVRTNRTADGKELTPASRAALEAAVKTASTVVTEISGTKQVYPTLTFNDSLTLWSGGRELRLFSATGDASGSAVLYLPREKLLITGDVLVRDEDNRGAQPWTTNSYKITPWLASLRRLEAIDATIIVPGQGGPLYDKTYLRNTIALYESLIAQVHAAMEKGAVRLDQVQAAVHLEAIRTRFTNDDPALNARFDRVAQGLIRKAFQEARDGLVGTG